MSTGQQQQLVQTQKLRLTQALATSIRVLRFDASGLTRYLEEQAERNPALVLGIHAPDPHAWSPRWMSAFEARPAYDGDDASAWIADRPAGLVAHVSAQADRILGTGRDRVLAQILIQGIEPSGWLSRPPHILAREAGVSQDALSVVLDRLRDGAEPTGLFALSLADCLRLQARDADLLDPVMECLLGHLDILASGDVARLARMCGVEPAAILRTLGHIRSFNPKPGAQFGQEAGPVREPDLTATRADGRWEVALSRSALPTLAIDARGGDAAAAREVERMVESRNATLLRVGRAILTRQAGALDRGLEALVPMTMADIAADTGLHASTVSRAVAGVAVDTPRGTWWLRTLFSTARRRDMAGDTGRDMGSEAPAAAAIRARLARLVACESPLRPLNDQALVEALVAEGMPLARRTLAKYRTTLGIPPAHRRRIAGA